MKHLLICGEYPPAPAGGIGAYAAAIARLLAEAGEVVHVIARLWEGADRSVEESCQGRLIVHRLPYEDWSSWFPRRPHPVLRGTTGYSLFGSDYPPLCFSWSAATLAEKLIAEEGVDVVEGQEYEAPLYVLQLRRALGLGPKRRPPCLVHLHSPTEMIARHNRWARGRADAAAAVRLESYSMRAADALLCPSRHLARAMEDRLGMPAGAIHVVPYLLGSASEVARDDNVWARGAISYVGRLEPRKGVYEWLEAALSAARRNDGLQFEFIGGDTFDRGSSIRTSLERQIPAGLKSAFCFRGEQPRSVVAQVLSRSRIAVVPSRWDNFPYACMEAMASGLPVVASREGGQGEMVADGETGWLARTPGSAGLAEALQRALETPPATLASMGRRAAEFIRGFCDNDAVVRSHLDLRRGLADRGAARTAFLPPRSEVAHATTSPQTVGRAAAGLAFVVVFRRWNSRIRACLESIARQSQPPVAVAIVAQRSSAKCIVKARQWGQRFGWRALANEAADLAAAKNEGIAALFEAGHDPIGIAALTADDCLDVEFVRTCTGILASRPNIGVLSCWATDAKARRAWARPCPAMPYQRLANDAGSFSVVRTEALRAAGKYWLGLPPRHDDWNLYNRILLAGWGGATVPEALVHRSSLKTMIAAGNVSAARRVIGRLPDGAAHAGDVAAWLAQYDADLPLGRMSAARLLRARLAASRALLQYPGTTSFKIWQRVRSKVLRRLPARVHRMQKTDGQAVQLPAHTL